LQGQLSIICTNKTGKMNTPKSRYLPRFGKIASLFQNIRRKVERCNEVLTVNEKSRYDECGLLR